MACGTLEPASAAATPDDASVTDGAGPATGPDASAPGTFCAQNAADATFCADFDDGSFAAFRTEVEAVGDAGTVDVKVANGVGFGGSPGLSLHLTSTSNPSQNVIYVRDLPIDTVASHGYTLELDARFHAFDVNYGVFAAFRYFVAGAPHVTGVAAVRQGAFDLFGSNPRVTDTPPSFFDTWHHFSFGFDRSQGGATTHQMVLSIDNAASQAQGIDLTGATSIAVMIGNFYGSGLVATDYVIDNVVVRVK